MTVDFSKLLSKPLNEVERPKPWPAGTYYGRVSKYELRESENKKTPYVRFHIQVTSAGNDIEPEALQAAKTDFSKKLLRRDFYLTQDAEYRLKEFISSCGMPTEGRTFSETLPETINAEVMLEVTLRPSQDGEDLFNDVAKLVGVR